jgi:hypothetical protein
MSEFHLRGLDGANPLGFLAALGTLRMATAAWPTSAVRMGWIQQSGGWRPRLEIAHVDVDEDVFLETLNAGLKKMEGHLAISFATDLNVDVRMFRAELAAALIAASPAEHVRADFLAAFGSDAIADEDGIISDTALRTMSGAGHQHFLGFMQQLVRETDVIHLRHALFETWRYQDDKPSMRWDPADDRRYALRWDEPSGDPVKTVRGANRLAIEALPLLPTMPAGRRLETTGFTHERGQGVLWSWPIWEPPICLDVVRSLIAMEELRSGIPDRSMLLSMGVREVFRSQRITQGKFRNFTPAVPV